MTLQNLNPSFAIYPLLVYESGYLKWQTFQAQWLLSYFKILCSAQRENTYYAHSRQTLFPSTELTDVFLLETVCVCSTLRGLKPVFQLLILAAVTTAELVQLRGYLLVLCCSARYVAYNFDSSMFVIHYYLICHFTKQPVWLQCQMFVKSTWGATVYCDNWL